MKILKKLTSIFLTVTMVTGSILTSGMSNTAYAAEPETITLPLKIRDAHLDGFIFEHKDSNAFNESGTQWKSATKGLIKSELDSDKKIVYTDGAIGILAGKIQSNLKNGIGSGAKYDKLYQALRTEINKDTSGNYTLGSSSHKPTKFEDITSCYGAAYWMTYYLFRDCKVDLDGDGNVDGGTFTYDEKTEEYTIPYAGYEYLVLDKQSDGSYLFQADKGAANVNYDKTNRLIRNTTESGPIKGGFFPLDGISGTEDANGEGGNHNFGYTLESSGKFIYHKNDELYFDFYGDDDVYLFINNKLALDIGGQHEQVPGRIDLEAEYSKGTSWADYLGLEEGGIYDFNFFYMERHTTEANMKIHTNIRVYDAQAKIQKNAYVDDKQIPYGGYVAQGTKINYEFVLTNETAEQIDISNLTFKDDNIGVDLSKTNIILNEGTKISDLTVSIGSGDNFTTQKVTTEELKSILANGITNGQTIKIKGFNYTLQDDAQFVNKVHYTANYTTIEGNIKTLNGSAQNIVVPVQSSDRAFVIDYGKPVTYDYKDVFNQVEASRISINHPDGDYGTMNNDTGNKTITYTLNKFMTGIDKFTFDQAITSTDDKGVQYTTNLQTNVKMIPATTIYYEDNFASSGTGNTDSTAGIIYGGNVVPVYTDGSNTNQDNTSGGVYGYDFGYSDDLEDSDGSSHKLTSSGDVISSAYFKFKGTGFDIVGRTSKDSGMIQVDVYDKDKKQVGDPIRVINTHKTNSNLGDTLYQIPVVKKQGLTYGEYTVLIRVFDSVLGVSDNNVFYLDGIRIYNPLGTEADGQYVADGEAYPTYTELGDKLVAVNNYNNEDEDTQQVGLFVEGKLAATLEEYKIIGPNNEIYLADTNEDGPGQSVGFNIDNYKDTNIASIQIGAKAINGTSAQITVGTGSKTQTIDLNSATDMYYDITDTVEKNNGIVIISSTGDNVASITNLKITHHESPASGEAGDTSKVSLSNEVFNAIKELEESKAQSPVVNSAKFKSSSVKVNNKATIVVETNLEAEEIKVSLNGKNVKLESSKLVQQKDGKKVFNVTIKAPSKAGKYVYEVSALNSDKSIESEKIKTNTLYTSKAQSPVVNSAKFKSSSVKVNDKATIVVETNLEAEEIKVSLNGKNVKLESSKLVKQKDGKKVFNVTIKAPSKKGKYVYQVSALNNDKRIESKKIKTNTLYTR